jgi:peroxiredoxin
MALVSDGTTLSVYLGPPFNKYESKPAPESIGGLVDAALMGEAPEGAMALVEPQVAALVLMDGEQFEKICRGADKIAYQGKEEVDGKPQDRVRLSGAMVDVDLVVAAEGDAWVNRVRPDLAKMFAKMKEMGGGPDMSPPKLEVTFADWKKREEFEEGTFAFKPPEGAEKVASLMEAMQKEMSGGDAEQQPDLLGKAAPEVGLELLDGGKLNLADYRDKKIVVLDFWATWCPPCVKGLPLVSKAALDLKDKGVVFFAVDQAEPSNTIKAFLEKKELKFPVALDKEGKAGHAYGVTGIPQTVVIGKDGTIQAVHVGYMDGMEDELTEQLKKLIDGKTLAAPKPAEPKEPGKP